ncbi:hypothetical protein ACH8E3_12310 [Paenibacillus sp. CMAA1364]
MYYEYVEQLKQSGTAVNASAAYAAGVFFDFYMDDMDTGIVIRKADKCRRGERYV